MARYLFMKLAYVQFMTFEIIVGVNFSLSLGVLEFFLRECEKGVLEQAATLQKTPVSASKNLNSVFTLLQFVLQFSLYSYLIFILILFAINRNNYKCKKMENCK